MRPFRKNMFSVRTIAIGVGVVVVGVTSCGHLPTVLYGKALAGQVVDAGSGAPIPGAHVAYLWESGIEPSGFTGHNSRTICYHAAATTTDADGRFSVEPWREWSSYQVRVADPVALVYAPKYVPKQQWPETADMTGSKARVNERYALKPFAGSVDERLDALWRGFAARGCDYGGQSQKQLYPMLKAIFEETRLISSTRDLSARPHSFDRAAARSALAEDPNGPANDSRVDRFIAEHLR
ncbi:MAG: carboxypeptidase-like regulatory domain-containing protein [Betaproteobacteria bacterium]